MTLFRLSGNRLGNIQGFTNYEVETSTRTFVVPGSVPGLFRGWKKDTETVIINQDYHIYILSNLHRIIFNAVLAHELLHVYLFQHHLVLESDVREGFCNLGSNIVYDHYGSKLGEYRIISMEESSDPDYGLGFKKMKSILDQIGWGRLLRKLDRL